MGILNGRVTAIFALLGGLALVALATDVVTVVAPHDARERHAYEAAPRCPALPSTPAECRWTEEFTVSDIHLVATGKNGADSAVLTGASGASWDTVYRDRGPILEKLDEGDRVTGTVWRGELTEIMANGVVQSSVKAPVDERPHSFMLALVLVPSGLLLIVTGAWRLRRGRGAPAMEATLALGLGLLGVGLFSDIALYIPGLFLPHRVADSFWMFAAIFLAAAGWLTVVVRRSLKRDAETPGIPI